MTDREASPSEHPEEAAPKPSELRTRGMRRYSLTTGVVGVFGIVLFLTAAFDVLDGNYAAATAFAVMACYAHLVSTWPYRSF